MLIFGHRGSAFDAPENTLVAIYEGLNQGADGVEIDVRTTIDNQVVAIHDGSFKRTGKIKDSVCKTHSSVIKNIDVGSYKGEKFIGEKVPFLSEILDIVPKGKLLQIEIKNGIKAVIPIINDIKASKKSIDEIMIIGFCRKAMKKMKEEMPSIKVAWINGEKSKINFKIQNSLDLVNICKENNFDGIDFDCRFNINDDFVKNFKKRGLELYSWTVDDIDKANFYKDLGVNGIATNRPKYIIDNIVK